MANTVTIKATVITSYSIHYTKLYEVDQCKAHGVWLDNGELIQLMEWKRAGGQMLDEQRERKRQEEQLKSRTAERNLAGVYHVTYGGEQEAEALDITLDELANSAVRFISKLFRITSYNVCYTKLLRILLFL